MSDQLKGSADAILERVVGADAPVAGVAAIATDRDGAIYQGAAGVRRAGSPEPFTTDTVCAIFSTTKAVAGTLALMLVQEGSLDLDAPASDYAPAIGDLPVIEGFAEDGSPRLRPPRRSITTRMLLTHTAGFGYDFFNSTYFRLAQEHGQASVITASSASISTPLLFDPGERWEYGTNIDWVGQVIEGITGQRLGEAMRERIFEPLGMSSTAFTMTDEMHGRMASIHQRADNGSISALDLVLPQDPEIHMAGHGLYSTPEDYVKFIRLWLNDGAAPDGRRLLEPATVEMAARNHLGDLKVQPLPGVIPALSNDAEFFPGMPKSWALTFMINDEDAPTGRPAGALAWAGLANLYYWIDRAQGVGGFWATQLFPFADATSVGGYLDFETAVYQSLRVPAAA
jgi:methyl acetate hydrolase